MSPLPPAPPHGATATRHAPPASPRAAPLSWGAMGRTWAALTAVVLASAAATAVVAPDWLDGPTRELPNDPRLMADIFFNNLLIVLLPLLGGWLAAGHRQAGRPRVAWIFVAVPTVVLMRSLLTIGAVGGADPAWLGAAARWWLLELGALAAATATGLWLVRHPHRREDHGPAMMRRALLIAVGALGCGTFIEVLTA